VDEVSDIEITKDAGEGMVAVVAGITDAGIEFVDAYVFGDMQVVDAGRIIIWERDLDHLLTQAKEAGLLTVEQ
jgi:hypothetical protein